jgi:hypothetical protein
LPLCWRLWRGGRACWGLLPLVPLMPVALPSRQWQRHWQQQMAQKQRQHCRQRHCQRHRQHHHQQCHCPRLTQSHGQPLQQQQQLLLAQALALALALLMLGCLPPRQKPCEVP